MKLQVFILVVIVVINSVCAALPDGAFHFSEKTKDGMRLGCKGSRKNGKLYISHYIHDRKGFRPIKFDYDKAFAGYETYNLFGTKKLASFRPLGESAHIDYYWPNLCFDFS